MSKNEIEFYSFTSYDPDEYSETLNDADDDFCDDFYDNFYDEEDWERADMNRYINETRKNGFVPYYSQFCSEYCCTFNEKSLELFESLL